MTSPWSTLLLCRSMWKYSCGNTEHKRQTLLLWHKRLTSHVNKCSEGLKKLLTWDVGQHDDDEAVVVVKRHVIHVGESHGVHSSSAYERQRGINGHQLSDDPQGVQNDEEGVSGEEERKIRKMWRTNRIHAAVTGSILEHTHTHPLRCPNTGHSGSKLQPMHAL